MKLLACRHGVIWHSCQAAFHRQLQEEKRKLHQKVKILKAEGQANDDFKELCFVCTGPNEICFVLLYLHCTIIFLPMVKLAACSSFSFSLFPEKRRDQVCWLFTCLTHSFLKWRSTLKSILFETQIAQKLSRPEHSTASCGVVLGPGAGRAHAAPREQGQHPVQTETWQWSLLANTAPSLQPWSNSSK